jgi:Mg2+-importing ATPase
VFVIRTRRVPFFRSRPSMPLALAAAGVVLVGAVLPASPLGPVLGFRALPPAFYGVLAVMVVVYVALIDAVKRAVFRAASARPRRPRRRLARRHRRLRLRAASFSATHVQAR